MFLKSVWESVRPRRKPRRSVDLNPVEQLAMRYLLNFGAGTMESVYKEVSATRVADHREVGEALARLVSEGLAESRFRLEGGPSETLFFRSKKGAKLRGRIPLEPHGVLAFYL